MLGSHGRLDPGHHLLDLVRSQAVLEMEAQRGQHLIRCELNRYQPICLRHPRRVAGVVPSSAASSSREKRRTADTTPVSTPTSTAQHSAAPPSASVLR